MGEARTRVNLRCLEVPEEIISHKDLQFYT